MCLILELSLNYYSNETIWAKIPSFKSSFFSLSLFFFGEDWVGLKLYYLIMVVYVDQKLLQLCMFWSEKAEANKLVVISLF